MIDLDPSRLSLSAKISTTFQPLNSIFFSQQIIISSRKSTSRTGLNTTINFLYKRQHV
jgi:hypothetical protein